MVPPAELDGAVSDLVAALLSTDAAAARATKALLQAAPGNTLEQQAAAERAAQASAPARAALTRLVRAGHRFAVS